jgi:hypothetical protein
MKHLSLKRAFLECVELFKIWYPKNLRVALASLGTLLATPWGFAFAGEDFLEGRPWYHQKITKEAAESCGFHPVAVNSLKWHADYIDSYLYNPLWWAQGGLDRLKVSLATYSELAKLHFDDLFTTREVLDHWRRILSGTLLGLLWAKERGDVLAAHNILGVSLHAIQDFYSHSNWVDAPERRNRTWFEVPEAVRKQMSLWTGSYEKPSQLGIKPHGKISPAATLLLMSGVRDIMPLICMPISPLSNSGLCETWKNIQEGKSARPELMGVRIPEGFVYLAPPGIALDNKWMSNIAVQVRGIRDVHGEALFQIAYDLAKRSSEQWLRILETQMNALGAGDFWRRVKGEGLTPDDRNSLSSNQTKPYEDYSNFPYTFLSAGSYPPPVTFYPAGGPQFTCYLRVRLVTGRQGGSGTDADIVLEADGQRFLLDYMPRANPVLAVNDFEAGDDMVYVVGPFPGLPSTITLHNDAASVKEVMESLGRAFVSAVESVLSNARTFLLSLIGGNADHVKSGKKVWTPEELAMVSTTGSSFSVYLDGGGEGKYTAYGTIRKVNEGSDSMGGWTEYVVSLDRLHCNKESEWDRGSDSDEPFLLTLLVPLPGSIQKHLAGPYGDVDSGESRSIGHTFATVRIPKNSGMLSIAFSLWESDDESSSDRHALLDKFAGETDKATSVPRRDFLSSLGAAIAPDWRLARIEVYAFSRDGMRSGMVLDQSVNQWVNAGKKIVFPLNEKALRTWNVTPSALESLTTPTVRVPIPPRIPPSPITP